MNLILGLPPQTLVNLSLVTPADALTAEVVNERLSHLSEVRPDLLALGAGYDSQEAQVRAAILAQFPSLGIGINRARDTSNVDTVGLSISLSLPLFSGNRGNIAIERATRTQLNLEYQARLAQAAIDVDQLLQLQGLLQAQLDNLQTYLPTLESLVTRATRAYQQGDIDALTFLNLESTWINKQLEQLSLQQASWNNRIALEALLALPAYPQTPVPLPENTAGDKK
ncbi:MAG: TolC family protein [Halioglobus sp.]